MNTLINDDQLYSEDLIDYWQRAADQLRWPFFYAFPEHCHDLQGRPLAVAVFRQLRVPRVAFVGAVDALDVSGFRLSLAEMINPEDHELLDVCLTVEQAQRAAGFYQPLHPDQVMVIFAHPDFRSMLRWPFYRYPVPEESEATDEDEESEDIAATDEDEDNEAMTG